MTGLATFGDPSRFAITIGWIDDPEPRDRRPEHGGWSSGVFRLTIGGLVITRHEQNEGECDDVRWYLLPLFEWLADHWVSLLHEEHFAWRENSAAPAATATFFMLRRLMDADDPDGRQAYRECRDWWLRHALRAADPSALLPDLYFRRFGDDIELSWTARQPHHPPDGYRLILEPGAATLSVADVAGPLWEALAWFVSTARVDLPEDRLSIKRIESRIAHLGASPIEDLEAGFLSQSLMRRVSTARRQRNRGDRSVRMDVAPAIERLDDAVLMFGGVSPDIGPLDFEALLSFLGQQSGGRESDKLTALVDDGIGAPLTAPHEEGYDLAEALIDDLALSDDADHVDILSLVKDFGIKVENHLLETLSIRGAAIAGIGYAPGILINEASPYNGTEAGRRFTLAHELFHILYDRSRARRVAHTSGPWAPPGIEKRANAFAAMLLMPRALVRRVLPRGLRNWDDLVAAAASLRVSPSTLIEHLYNTHFIDDMMRDDLRSSSRPTYATNYQN
ncbi:hypothetical protein ASF27_10570 [Methylobacterium sp. Leaf102]|uniref:ImmA/IrrE family metallo-endopeptidase n=1 Tax=Methylobacterium sp. Leaf102 TaxID=1736253 RepID=UPI0006F9B067|nr:ImmA/IrrE family metallo-endopeptidase [Methylobacterium sp. Leaf102]KQP24539.1 hypothetical protein ASF27_10570 [Methylobacterium sp. Leaf102]